MAVIILILILLTIFHFVYESIIAPSLRIKIRYKLFELRDELRRLKFNEGQNISEDVFKQVDYSVNSSIKHLPFYNFKLLYDAKKEFDSNEKLKKQVEQKIGLIEECHIDSIREIFDKTNRYSSFAFLINTGAWLLYLFPFIVILILIAGFNKALIKLKQYVARIAFAPEKNFNSIYPKDDLYPNIG